jgi:hypothetical protein
MLTALSEAKKNPGPDPLPEEIRSRSSIEVNCGLCTCGLSAHQGCSTGVVKP